MIRFYNTKMLSPLTDEPSGDPVTPEKGTYAYDKMRIEHAKSNLPTDPDPSFIHAETENAITYFESDHPVETEEPNAEKQIIHNHDYILEVTPSEDALVRASKELLDAEIRASVVPSIENSDGPVV